MNEFDRYEKFQRKLLLQNKAGLVLEVALYLLFVLMACFWWYGEPGKEVGKFNGGMAVVLLWVYTFNHLPSHGVNCIKHPRAIIFQIPASVIATIGYAIGLYST